MAKYISKPDSGKTLLAKIKTENEAKKNPIIIAGFKNGKVKSSRKSSLKFASYHHKHENSKRIIVAKSRLCYVGSNYETDLSKITSTTLKVCVLNRKTSTVNLYDADFFQLKPQIKCGEIFDTKIDKTYAEKSSDLTIEFGSKSQQRKINSKIKYDSEVASSNVSFASTISSISDTALEQKEVKTSDESSISSLIPPQNSSAENVDEVYNIYDIISNDEYEMLDSEANVFLQAKFDDIQQWKTENKYTDFVIQFMENNLLSMNVQKAKYLCYLNFMFCFLKTTYKDWQKKDPVSDVPQPFKEKLMEKFTVNRSMPGRLKDKMLAYCLVLALKLNSYVINCNVFASSSKIAMKRITTVAYGLGCHVSGSRSDQVKIITLRLPLHKFEDAPKRKFKKL